MDGGSEGGRLSATGGEDRGRRMGKPDLTPVTTAKPLFPVHTHSPLHAGTLRRERWWPAVLAFVAQASLNPAG